MAGKATTNQASETGILSPRGVTWTGLVCNALLAGAKIAAGVLFSSKTILADGLHSSSDLVTDIAVLAGLRASQRPADSCHPYGHQRITTMVAMFVGATLLLAAAWIAYSAMQAIRAPAEPIEPTIPLLLAIASVPVKELLFRLTRRAGRISGNLSLMANAWHHRSDALTSIAAAAGLAGVLLGGAEWQFLDQATAILLAAFLIVVAFKIMRIGAAELIDRAPAAKALSNIEQLVRQTSGVQSYHAIRARQIGGRIAMDLHIQVDPSLTVAQGHDIASAVKHTLTDSSFNVVEVIVHIEPGEIKR